MNIFDLRKVGVAVLVVLLLSLAATGFAQKVTDYTADQVTMGADGKFIKQSKVYFPGGKCGWMMSCPSPGPGWS